MASKRAPYGCIRSSRGMEALTSAGGAFSTCASFSHRCCIKTPSLPRLMCNPGKVELTGSPVPCRLLAPELAMNKFASEFEVIQLLLPRAFNFAETPAIHPCSLPASLPSRPRAIPGVSSKSKVSYGNWNTNFFCQTCSSSEERTPSPIRSKSKRTRTFGSCKAWVLQGNTRL